MPYYVKATTIVKGDTILVFSRRRVNPTKLKVKAVHSYDDIIHFDTPTGRVTVPAAGQVQVPRLPTF
jgi:hypothetical protein